MKILALDPSASVTGWCFFDGKEVCNAGWVQFKKTEYNGDRYLEAKRWLKDALNIWKPDLVLTEGYFFSKRFATGTSVNSEIRGCLKMTVREAELPYKVINPTEWKKTLMGRVYPTKAEKRKYGKLKANKMITYTYLIDEYDIFFPEKVTNPRTNKMINFKFDISDAIGILIAHLRTNKIPFTVNKNPLGD